MISHCLDQKLKPFISYIVAIQFYIMIQRFRFCKDEKFNENINSMWLSYIKSKYRHLVSDTTVRSMEKIPLLLGPKFLNLGLTRIDASINRRKKLFDEWAERYIEQLINKVDKQQSQSSKNVIELLFYENKKGQKAENYSKEQLVDQLKVFFFAGSDTTAHFVYMMIYLTAKDPQVLEKVHKQIKQLQFNSTSIKRMKYIQCIQIFWAYPSQHGKVGKKVALFQWCQAFQEHNHPILLNFYSLQLRLLLQPILVQSRKMVIIVERFGSNALSQIRQYLIKIFGLSDFMQNIFKEQKDFYFKLILKLNATNF